MSVGRQNNRIPQGSVSFRLKSLQSEASCTVQVYLTTLEAMKSASSGFAQSISSNETQAAGTANFIAGAVASLLTQSIIVPVDVVSQRLMVHDRQPKAQTHSATSSSSTSSSSSSSSTSSSHSKPQLNHARSVTTAALTPGRQNGLALARQIVQQEGIRGLYRGFGASVATFVPSSAIWWSAYGAYQKTIWHQYESLTGNHASGSLQARSSREVLTVQTSSALLAGCTSAVLTNPLDVIKTRLQVASRLQGGPAPSFLSVGRQLIAEEGAKGLLRGVAPRVTSTGMWGTAMVTTYEFLKRVSIKPEFADA